MNPLLAQLITLLVVLVTLMMLLLMGYLLWLQRRGVVEQNRQREAERQRLAARWLGRYPPSCKPPRR